MKITFLGSSHGVPAADRYCSSLMVEVGEKTYVIDAGAPLMDCLLRHGKTPTDVQAIFITHTHGDHIDGLVEFVDLVDWYYKNDTVEIYTPEQSMIDGFEAFWKLALHRPAGVNARISFAVAPSDFVYDDGNLKVTYIPTKHVNGGARPSYAMLLEAEGKRVIVTGDLSQNLALGDFPKVASEIETDLIVCEMAHFGVSKVKPYLDICKTRHISFTHVAPAKRFDDIEAIKGVYPFEISIAKDDDEIVL